LKSLLTVRIGYLSRRKVDRVAYQIVYCLLFLTVLNVNL